MSGYSTGLCACLDDKPSVIDSLCCYPCQIGYQFGAVNGNGDQMSIMHCFLSAVGAFQCCICMIRRSIDEKYNVGEGCCVSLCMAYFFPWCSLCQTHRELEYRGAAPSGICIKILGGAAGMTKCKGEQLNKDGKLLPDEFLQTSSGHKFIHQTDGNVVLYNKDNAAIWASGTCGQSTAELIMQGDGNLVLYGPTHNPLWASNTCGSSGDYAIMQSDGNFVIYATEGAGKRPVWATNTMGK